MKRAVPTTIPALIVLLAMAFSVGCGEEEDDTEVRSVTEFFLTSDDLSKPGNVSNIDKSAILNRLSDQDNLYANREEKEADDFLKCYTDLTNQIKTKATSTRLEIGFEIDVGKCLEKLATSTETTKISFKDPSVITKGFMVITCEAGGLENLDQKSFEEFDKLQLNCEGAKIRTEVTSISKYTVESESEGKTASGTVDSKSVYYTGTEALGFCTVDSTAKLATNVDCVDVDSYVQTTVTNAGGESSTSTEADWFKAVWEKGTQQSSEKGDIWMSSGSATVSLNNWSGQITYTNASTAPTAKVSDGTNTIEGALTASASLSLRSALAADHRKRLAQSFQGLARTLSSLGK